MGPHEFDHLKVQKVIRSGDIVEERKSPRSSDDRMFWIAVVGPILSFVIGSCAGATGAAWVYRDHEHRIARLESDSQIYRDVIVTLKAKGIVQ